MIDTSVMVAGLVRNHQFHAIARPHLLEATRVPGIVVAETWAALRRAPWNLDASTVAAALAPWASEHRILPTSGGAYVQVLHAGRALNVGGNVHDLLIALTCHEHGLPIVTLDRRQATIARTIPDLDARLILPEA